MIGVANQGPTIQRFLPLNFPYSETLMAASASPQISERCTFETILSYYIETPQSVLPMRISPSCRRTASSSSSIVKILKSIPTYSRTRPVRRGPTMGLTRSSSFRRPLLCWTFCSSTCIGSRSPISSSWNFDLHWLGRSG